MIRKDLIIVAIATFCLTTTLFLIVPTKSQSGFGEYDPWADYDEDGKIDILDMSPAAISFGATGDSTKNVTVVNWPVAKQRTVFYERSYRSSSVTYNASGFSQMHLVYYVGNLSGPEIVYLYIGARIDNLEGVPFTFPVEKIIVTQAESNERGALTFPVPSEIFWFYFDYTEGTAAYVDLAFYLTYA